MESGLAGAAGILLEERILRLLKTVRRCSKQGCCPDDVHKLRIATRRTDAVLRMFAVVMPRQRVRSMRQSLRQLRRAAGAVRNLDVLVERIESLTRSDAADAAESWVLSELRNRSGAAREHLSTVLESIDPKHLKRRLGKLQSRIRWHGGGGEPTVASAALLLVRPEIDRFLNSADRDLTDIARVHRLRLQGKRLRYMFESVERIWGNAVPADRLTSALRRMQEQLGDLNDQATAIEILGSVRREVPDDSSRSGTDRLIDSHRRELNERHDAFLSWWSDGGRHDLAVEIERALLALAQTGALIPGHGSVRRPG